MYLSELEDDGKKREVKFYDNMQDVIGRLHDKQVLLDLLKNKSGRAHRAQLSSINSECLSDKREIFRLASDYYKKSQVNKNWSWKKRKGKTRPRIWFFR